jgi:hypothetical protein
MAADVKESALKPLADTLVDFLKLPIDMMNETLPEVRREVAQMPEVLRMNRDYALDRFKQMPGEVMQNFRDSNPVLTMTRAASPFPILSPQEIQAELAKNAPRQASSEIPVAQPSASPAKKK